MDGTDRTWFWIAIELGGMLIILVDMAGIVSESRRPTISWTEPEGLHPRGTVVVVPGRGESPEVYERFGRRLAFDAYRVHVVDDPTGDPAGVGTEVAELLGATDAPAPRVLAGSDTGALFAAGLVASGEVAGLDALILAGLPSETSVEAGGWDDELEARTTCPTHRGALDGHALRRGALYEPVPGGWQERADLGEIRLPILGLHGLKDPLNSFEEATRRFEAGPRAGLIGIASTRHDVLNDQTHRTVAATIVQFLERLRVDPTVPMLTVKALDRKSPPAET